MKRFVSVVFGLCLFVSSVAAHADLTQGLVAYWPFNGNANDESGNGNDGTLYGGATLCADRFGTANRALCLDGVDDYVDIGPGVKPPFPLSVSVWVKRDVLAQGSISVIRNDRVYRHGCCYYGIQIYLGYDGRVECMYGDGGYASGYSRRSYYTNDVVITAGEWHHIVAKYNAHVDIEIYVDGIKREGYLDPGTTGSTMAYSGNSGAIGVQNGGEYWFMGSVDDIRFYNRALSEGEILALAEDRPDPIWGPAPAEATSVYGNQTANAGSAVNYLATLLFPVGVFIVLRYLRRRG